jgi:hypothetical protein
MSHLSITDINKLDVPAKGNKFYGFATWTAKTDKGRPLQIPKGLGVVVTANGVRSFALNYVINGRERRATIGQVGTVAIPMALQEAKKLRGLIENKIDPLAHRDEAKAKVAEARGEQPVECRDTDPPIEAIGRGLAAQRWHCSQSTAINSGDLGSFRVRDEDVAHN